MTRAADIVRPRLGRIILGRDLPRESRIARLLGLRIFWRAWMTLVLEGFAADARLDEELDRLLARRRREILASAEAVGFAPGEVIRAAYVALRVPRALLDGAVARSVARYREGQAATRPRARPAARQLSARAEDA